MLSITLSVMRADEVALKGEDKTKTATIRLYMQQYVFIWKTKTCFFGFQSYLLGKNQVQKALGMLEVADPWSCSSPGEIRRGGCSGHMRTTSCNKSLVLKTLQFSIHSSKVQMNCTSKVIEL